MSSRSTSPNQGKERKGKERKEKEEKRERARVRGRKRGRENENENIDRFLSTFVHLLCQTSYIDILSTHHLSTWRTVLTRECEALNVYSLQPLTYAHIHTHHHIRILDPSCVLCARLESVRIQSTLPTSQARRASPRLCGPHFPSKFQGSDLATAGQPTNRV